MRQVTQSKNNARIDGAVATIMELDRAIRCGSSVGGSIYDERGVLVL